MTTRFEGFCGLGCLEHRQRTCSRVDSVDSQLNGPNDS